MSAVYKGVQLLKAIGPDFLIWEDDVLGFVRRTNKPALDAMLKAPAADVVVNVEEGAAGNVRVVIDEADLEAASLIRMFMTVELKHMYMHLKSGRVLWIQLRSDFDAYANAMAPVFAKSLRAIGPEPGETAAVYIARAQALGRQLEALGRKEDEQNIRDLIWEGFERERPAWETTIKTMRVSMPTASLADILIAAESCRSRGCKPDL